MSNKTMMISLALLVALCAGTASANMDYEMQCVGDALCEPCHMGGYTGVCVEEVPCVPTDDDDDSAGQDCAMLCVTNTDSELLAEQCPDVELPSCECSASGATAAATVPGFALLIGLAVMRLRKGRRGRNE